jgi:hypothetical protein
VIALSCNDTDSHKGWIEDIKKAQGLSAFSYPIIADPKRELAVCPAPHSPGPLAQYATGGVAEGRGA